MPFLLLSGVVGYCYHLTRLSVRDGTPVA